MRSPWARLSRSPNMWPPGLSRELTQEEGESAHGAARRSLRRCKAAEKKRKEQQKAAARGQSELKELKMSYKIGDHDYGVRKKQASKFLSSGDKVKFSMLFRGREVTHADVGREIMLRMANELEDLGILDSPPKVMGRQMIMMISPKPRNE